MSELPGFNPDDHLQILPTPEDMHMAPTYNLEVFASFHGTAEDFEKIDQDFNNADVVILEIAWTADDLHRLAEISEGNRMTEDDGTAYGHFNKLLYNSKKPVMVVDVPLDHESIQKHFESTAAFDDAIKLFKTGQFDAALTNYDRGALLSAESAIAREQHMAERLKVMLPQLQDRFPELAGKDKLNILMPIGATHTTLVHNLVRAEDPDLKVTMVLGSSPLVFNYNQQLEREFKMGVTPKEGILAKALLGAFVASKVREFVRNTNEANEVERQLVDVVGQDEIRSFSEQLGNLASEDERSQLTTNKVLEWIDKAKS